MEMNRMKRAGIVGTGILLLSLVAGCSTEDEPDRRITGGEYSNAAIGLKLTFPSTWQIKADQVFGSYKFDIVALAPPVNGFSPNLNVLYGPHDGPTAMTEVLPMVKAQLQAAVADLSGYQDSILAVNGKEVGQIDYETTSQGILLHYRIHLFMNRGQDITLTYTDRADHFPGNADLQSVQASMVISP